MSYSLRPCFLPQNLAFPPCKTREWHRELGSQAIDMARFLRDERHREGNETEFSPCSQGEPGGAAAALDAGVGATVLAEELGEFSSMTPPSCSAATSTLSEKDLCQCC